MYKILSVLILGIALVSCKKKPDCELTAKYAATAGNGIGQLFACKNTVQIGLDIQASIEKLKLCENQPTGPISALVCKPVAAYATTLIVNKTLPKKWECSGGVGAGAVEAIIYDACIALPF